MADKIRFGVVGLGGIAHGHVSRLLQYEESEIVALVEPVEKNIERYMNDFPQLRGVKIFNDYRDMLNDGVALDAVHINTPHTLHYDQIMDSLDSGLHVLTEKPMVCTVSHAKSLIKKLDETGKVLVISYQRHYQPEFIYIKQQIESGLIGKVTAVAALQGQNWLRGQKGQWRQDPALSGGGQLNDSGSHLLDILLWVTGLAIEQVMAYIDNRGTQVDINSAVAIKFDGGAVGTITVIGDQPGWWEDFTVWGEKGAIFSRNGQLTISLYDGEPYSPSDLPAGSDPDRNFIDVILNGAENKTSAICGLRGIELCEAAWKSAELGRPVSASELG